MNEFDPGSERTLMANFTHASWCIYVQQRTGE